MSLADRALFRIDEKLTGGISAHLFFLSEAMDDKEKRLTYGKLIGLISDAQTAICKGKAINSA